MIKEVKKEVKQNRGSGLEIYNSYYYVISAVKETGCLPSFESMNMTKQARQYYVKNLVARGVLYKKGYSIWGINEIELKKFLDGFKSKEVKQNGVLRPALGIKSTHKEVTPKSKEIRGHGFQWTVKIPRIQNWQFRRDYLNKKGIDWKPVGSNWKGESIEFKDHRVWLTDKSIVIYSPAELSYFASTADTALRYAQYDMIMLMKSLGVYLGVDFSFKGAFKWRVSRAHYAHINDSLAKQCSREGRQLKIADKDGVWLITDLSFTDELETVHPVTSKNDMDKIVTPFLNKLKENPNILADLEKYMLSLSQGLTAAVEVSQVQAKLNEDTARGLKIVVEYLQMQMGGLKGSGVVETSKKERPSYIL
jgi:hypothetical protein